jgi:hypothetical protein
MWIEDESAAYVFELPGSDAAQVGWTSEVASSDAFLFVNQTFDADYDPVGLWVIDAGVLDADTTDLFNTWACSGLRTVDLVEKPAHAAWTAAFAAE